MEDYINENDDFEFESSYSIEKQMDELRVTLIERNYKALVENGVDFDKMVSRKYGIKPVIELISAMIEHYAELEEYEKCSFLSKITDLAVLYKSDI